MKEPSMYELLGMGKSGARRVFRSVVETDFPLAPINIKRHSTRRGVVLTMHSGGDGSKILQRLLVFLVTGDQQAIEGSVDDAFAMNLGGVATGGFVSGHFILTENLAINSLILPKELIMEQIARRVRALMDIFRSYGFNDSHFLGGKTSDLLDQVSSVVYDVAVYAETNEENVVAGEIKPGDRIFGFASDGRASWEQEQNSGIMDHGFTLARTCLMDPSYGYRYPFLVRPGGAFRGKFKVTDQPDILRGMTVSQALLSPTRQWAIFIRRLIERLQQLGISKMLHGIIMNTGGGATRIGRIGRNLIFEKTMPNPPPIFHLIKQASGESWRNLYKVLNCGVGLDVIGEDDRKFRRALKQVSDTTRVKMFDLGVCRRGGRENEVILKTRFGRFDGYYYTQ